MSTHVYRYRWGGLDLTYVNDRIPPAFPATAVAVDPDLFIDLSTDDGAKADLDDVMSQIGYTFEQTDPTVPLGTCSPRQITFRPGVASDDCNKATWAEVEIAIADAQGKITVLVDDRVAAAEVPATADTECFGLVVLKALNLAESATLTILDGGRFRNIGEIDSVIVLGAPTATIPLYFGGIGGFQALLLSGAVIGNMTGATVAMIEADNFFEIESQLISDMNNQAEPAVPIVHIRPNRFFGWNVQQNADSPMSPNLIEGDATTTLNLDNDASIVFVPQALFAGTLGNQSRLSKAEALLPSSGNTRPSGPFPGQMHFDTNLLVPIPIWWNGANWVNAAGAIV